MENIEWRLFKLYGIKQMDPKRIRFFTKMGDDILHITVNFKLGW